MIHLLNNMSEEEKKSILEQHYTAKHKNSIKIAETQLEDIVKKALNEQSIPSTSTPEKMGYRNFSTLPEPKEDINPKKLKLGDGGKLSPKLIPDVKILQQKLIDLGLLKTETGKPTGYFGDQTNKALNNYNSTKEKTATTKTGQERSLWDKAKEFCMSPVKRLKELTQLIDEKILYAAGLEPHYRAFSLFLLGKNDPLTENFFKPEELNVIRKKVEKIYPIKCKRSQSCNISFYSDDTDWAKVKSGEDSKIPMSLEKSVGYTLGNGQVQDMGSYYLIKDIYDFEPFHKHPEAYTLENTPDTIKKAFKKITCGNLVQGIEELASFKQASGYKGYPVEIKIPKQG